MKKHLFFLMVTILVLNGCNRDDESNPTIRVEKLNGVVQKGPFINGTSISVNELNSDLSQTGKVFNTQITDNNGSFEIDNVELASTFVGLRADGFYFNEILGEQSTSQITLYALSDLSDNSTVNVNVLSHLEKPRVEFLRSQGLGFQDAKSQAQMEISGMFNINTSFSDVSEVLDISLGGDNNAFLLATSLILQGYRTEGELTELLSNIGTDMKEDGILSSSSIGSQLINHAIYLDTISIRSNLEERYADLGVSAEIPNFEKYIRNFIDSTSFEITESLIEYPATGLYGENVLALEQETYTGEWLSLASNLTNGMKLKIKITALDDGIWFNTVGSSSNWSISSFNDVAKTQYFTAIDSGSSCELKMTFYPGEYLIEYFEMEVTEPTRSKIITI